MIEYLTVRERVILRLIADGVKRQVIADELRISRNTLNTHCKHIFGKLGAVDAANAVYIAISSGVIQ